MSTKGSHKRSLNRNDKRLAENWKEIDFKSSDTAKAKRKEVKIGNKTRITYGSK